MRLLPAVTTVLITVLSAGQCLATESTAGSKRISEADVRFASAWAYSDLLLQAYRKGWRYTPSAIESGFKRHFEELKLQLIDQGYTIVLGDTARGPQRRSVARQM